MPKGVLVYMCAQNPAARRPLRPPPWVFRPPWAASFFYCSTSGSYLSIGSPTPNCPCVQGLYSSPLSAPTGCLTRPLRRLAQRPGCAATAQKGKTAIDTSLPIGGLPGALWRISRLHAVSGKVYSLFTSCLRDNDRLSDRCILSDRDF